MTPARPQDVALLCNPRAGGRWRVLADVLDSEEAKDVHRIVTDEIDDIREAITSLGKRVSLLCIYGGDGTIYRVVNELLREGAAVPRLALLSGGTMNVTAAWLGMSSFPGENFRRIMRAHRADKLVWREVPLLTVKQKDQVRYGFTFGLGPLVRILERYEADKKSRTKAVELGLKSILAAMSGVPRGHRGVLRELEARVVVDGKRLPYDSWAALFANVTGSINPFIEPFTDERTRETFHYLSYAISSREFAMMVPLLARGMLPIDARSLLQPMSSWRKALLTLVGKDGLPTDPRYINQPAHTVNIETAEKHYTIDGEFLTSIDRTFDVALGPQLHLATLKSPRRTK